MKDPKIREDEVLEKLGLLDQYILQKKEGYRFTIDPILLAGFARCKDKDKILDLGTGGGILPFLLQKNNKNCNLEIMGIDIQEAYIDMAERSCAINKKPNIRFSLLDIREIGKEFAGKFDMVITNPPFFRPGEGRISDKSDIAVARHELEIDFQTIVQKAAYCLNSKGRFVFVQRSQRLMEIGELVKNEKMRFSRIQLIYPNKGNGSKLFMAEAVKRTGVQLKMSPPLIIYDLQGNYTEEVRRLYE